MLLILFFFVYIIYNMYIMTATNKKKLTYSLWSIVYLMLTIAIVVSATSLFNNFYYESVYVSGSSMNPTFQGDGTSKPLGSDYGTIDKSSGAKHSIKRYQIVTTYYPNDPEDRDQTSYKIKRVIAKPGEKFKIEDNSLYIYNSKKGNAGWGNPIEMPFDRNLPTTPKSYPVTELDDDEYFLAGDNWANSYDSFSVGPIEYDLLVGVVVKMQGRCTIKDGKVIEKETYATRYFLGVDY